MKNIITWSIIFWLLNAIIFTLSSISCQSKYWDAYIKPLAWCMVKYKGEYITEELYKKSFEQNIILNNK